MKLLLTFLSLWTGLSLISVSRAGSNDENDLNTVPTSRPSPSRRFTGHQENLSGVQCQNQSTAELLPGNTSELCLAVQKAVKKLEPPRQESIKEILENQFHATDYEFAKEPNGSLRGKASIRFGGLGLTLGFQIQPNGDVSYVIPRKDAKLSQLQFSSHDLSQGAFNCLSMSMALSKEPKSSSIHWVNSFSSCGLPEKRGGTLIMELATALNYSHRIHESKLIDASTVQCSQGDTSTLADLGFLRTMETGTTWYEKFGFNPSTSAEDGIRFNKVKRELKNYSLDNVEQTIKHEMSSSTPSAIKNHFNSCIPQLKKLNQLAKAFSETRPKEKTLGPFMSWVWKHHCKDYSAIMEVLFKQANFEKPPNSCSEYNSESQGLKKLGWINKFQEFEKLGSSLAVQYAYPEECVLSEIHPQ